MLTLLSPGRRLLLVFSAAVICTMLLYPDSGSTAILSQPDPHALIRAASLTAPHPVRATPTRLVLTLPASSMPVFTTPATVTPTAGAVPGCTTVFPVERVEELLIIPMSLPQLEAAFGQPAAIGGRPTRLRIEARGCTLLITPGNEVVQEAELVDYGALNWLLDRYGDPAAVGVSQGNLVLPMTGYTVLLYPDSGIVAVFACEPEELTATMPVNSLFFRPPYTLNAQIRRLNLQLVDADVNRSRFPLQ